MTKITYVIDPKESELSGLLAIRLNESGKTAPSPAAASHKSLSASLLRQLATATEKDVIELLIKEELHFQRSQTGRAPHAELTSFHLVHISNSQAISVLKGIAGTQQLYFNGKQLIADFYTKIDFYYEVDPLPEQGIQITGRLKWRDQDVALSECEWLGQGRPFWFIRGLSLKIIATSVNWKHIQQARKTFTLYGIEKATFLEGIDPSDLDSPQIVMKSGKLEEIAKIPDPLPLLILKDRSGAFADLWMDYGEGHRIFCHSPLKDIQNSDKKNIGKRNFDAEKNWEKDLLETNFIKKEVSNSHYYCPLDKVAKSLTFLLEVGWLIQDWKGQRVVPQKELSLNIDATQNALIIKGKVSYEGYEADLTHVVGAFNRRERFVQLNNGTIGLLPDRTTPSELQELSEESEIVSEGLSIKKSHIGALSPLFTQTQVMTPSLKDLKEKLQNFQQIQEALPGMSFKGILRPYQQQGVNWLAFLLEYGFHGILADDMGLGKTVQVLALLSRLSVEHPHLIVVPTSLLFNWKKELETFLPETSFIIHYGPKRAKTVESFASAQVILTSYATLRLDLALLQRLSYHSLILDEAQVIKNAHTQTAQAVCTLHSQFRLSITGTPLENHLGELWSHFHFLMPDLFEDEKSFISELQAAESDNRYLQRIKRKIAPFILRRKKEEVAKDLPERIDQTVWVEMNEGQRQLYERFLAGFKNNLLKKVELEGASKHRIEIFEAILRLRQICCHPLLVSTLLNDRENDSASALSSAKCDTILQDLETIVDEGRKVLIYSQFTSVLHILSRAAKERNWAYAYLDGSTTNREKVITSFQEDASIQLFFISLKAGGVGLNLTAADYVLLCDPWWNEAVEEQAINRAHRIGRKETVIAKRYITVESIEEKIMSLKAAKRQIIEGVLENEGENLSLTAEDLRFLLD